MWCTALNDHSFKLNVEKSEVMLMKSCLYHSYRKNPALDEQIQISGCNFFTVFLGAEVQSVIESIIQQNVMLYQLRKDKHVPCKVKITEHEFSQRINTRSYIFVDVLISTFCVISVRIFRHSSLDFDLSNSIWNKTAKFVSFPCPSLSFSCSPSVLQSAIFLLCEIISKLYVMLTES